MTSRPPALVAISAFDDARLLSRALEAVLSALAPADRVLVLADDPAKAGKIVGNHRRITVREHPRHDLAVVLAEESAALGGPVVHVEDHAVLPGRRWLDDLLTPLVADPTIGAVAPMTNGAPYPQCPRDVPDLETTRNDIRAVAQRVAESGRALAPIVTAQLDGPVVALSQMAVGAIARQLVAFDTDALATATKLSGLALAIVPNVYVHATRNLPLITACMIMKNEEEFLVSCLGSLEDLVDEVVIYDTGSTDGSIQLARTMGATVIEGYWDDDFARARNEALAYSRGSWVLHIDADEIIEEDPVSCNEMRGYLNAGEPIDVVSLMLYNLEGSKLAPTRSHQHNYVSRIFRRTRCRWVGALHEEPTILPGLPSIRVARAEVVHILHKGYLNEVIEERGKRDRNLRIAKDHLNDHPDPGKAHFNIARSYCLAHRNEEAVSEFALAAEIATNPVIKRSSLEHGAQNLIDLGRPDEALEVIDQLRPISENHGVPRWLEARARLSKHEWDTVIELLDGIDDYNDRYSNNTIDALELIRAYAHRGAGRNRDAAEACVRALEVNIQSKAAWSILAGLFDDTADILDKALEHVSAEKVAVALSEFLAAPLPVADHLAEKLWELHPGHRALLAFATEVAKRTEPERMLEWAIRLRKHGLAYYCPVATLARSDDAPYEDRLRAAITAVDRFDDDGVRSVLEQLVQAMSDDELVNRFRSVLDDAVNAADSFIVAGATSIARCELLADALADAGHDNEAAAVRSHAAGLASV